MTPQNKKIALGVSLLLFVGLAIGGTIWYVNSTKIKPAEKKEEPMEPPPNPNGGGGSPTPPNPNGGGSGSNPTSGATPFKNQTEGDVFRNWVNDTYPAYARSIDLDRSYRDYDNSNIRQAWAKYGAMYLQTTSGHGTGNGTPNNTGYKFLYAKRNGDSIYSVILINSKIVLDKVVGTTSTTAGYPKGYIGAKEGEIIIGGNLFVAYNRKSDGKRMLVSKAAVTEK